MSNCRVFGYFRNVLIITEATKTCFRHSLLLLLKPEKNVCIYALQTKGRLYQVIPIDIELRKKRFE